MANIIPAILENNLEEIENKLSRLDGLVELAQIDLADGIFVNNKLITPEDLNKLKSPINLEAHLMVANPQDWLPYINPEIFRRIYFHIEAVPEPEDLILRIKDMDVEPGIAINLDTPLENLVDEAERVDSILFMAIQPGFQGQKFEVDVLEKIDTFINQFPDHLIAVDGGINESNIMDVVKVGADNLCMGSSIFANNEIENNLNKFNNIIS